MDEHTYRAHPALNWSLIKPCGRSAAYAKHRDEHPGKHSTVGSYVHALLLEPGKVAADFATVPADLRVASNGALTTKDARAWVAEQRNAGRRIVKADEVEACGRIVAGFRACESAARLLAAAQTEVRFFWSTDVDGEPVQCKGAADILVVARDAEGEVSRVILADYKTSGAVTPAEFWRNEARKYHYLGQLAMYGDGLVAAGIVPRVDDYLWIVSNADTGETFVCRPGKPETHIDHATGEMVRTVDQTAEIEAGRAYWRRCLETWVRAERSGHFGGAMAGDEIHTIEVADWHLDELRGD